MHTRWAQYYEKQLEQETEPRKTLLDALNIFQQAGVTGSALDLGCGMGTDTVELLRRGWHVMAVDSNTDALNLLSQRVAPAQAHALTVRKLPFENLSTQTLKKVDLINASLSIPFCRPEYFAAFWQQVIQLLDDNGIFCGHFFGPNDDWYGNALLSFHSMAQVKELFSEFTIESAIEEEYEKPAGYGGLKHWHIISVVARKKQNQTSKLHTYSTSMSTNTTSLKSLEETLSYPFDEVIYRFLDEHDMSFEEAKAIFLETKKWLWLNAKAQNDKSSVRLFINADLLIIDEMWHTFILYTSEYTKFCKNYFGHYLHHKPSTKAEKEEMRGQRETINEAFIAEYEKRTQDQYEYIYDNLGNETLNKWHLQFPQKYTPAYIKSIKK